MPNYKKGGMSGMRNSTEGQVMPRTQFGGPPKEIWEGALQTRSLVKRARNEVARTRLPLLLVPLVCNLALFPSLRATGARARREA